MTQKTGFTQKISGRNAYRRQLVDQFDLLFPPQLFKKFKRELPQHGNLEWTPQKILWLSLLLHWLPGNTLSEQFSVARHVLKVIKPHWKIPVSYSGFVDAQCHCWPVMSLLIFAQLRPSRVFHNGFELSASWRIDYVSIRRFFTGTRSIGNARNSLRKRLGEATGGWYWQSMEAALNALVAQRTKRV